MACLFCGYADCAPGAFCGWCGNTFDSSDLPDSEAAVRSYVQHLRDTLFEPMVAPLQALEPGYDGAADDSVRKRLRLSFAASQRIHAELLKLQERVKPLLELKLEFDSNLNEAYADADVKLRFQLTNTSSDLSISKATFFWDDPDWEDNRDFLAATQTSVAPGKKAVISGNHVFKRGGDKSISAMFMRVDRLSESVLLRLHTIDFYVGNPKVSVQNIIHNTNTTQVSVEGTGAIFRAGEIGAAPAQVVEERPRGERWVDVAFSYVHDDEFSDDKVDRAARDLKFPRPHRIEPNSKHEAASVSDGLLSSGATLRPVTEASTQSTNGPSLISARGGATGTLRCQCGAVIKPGNRLCIGCGAPVGGALPAAQPIAESAPVVTEPAVGLHCSHCGAAGGTGRWCGGCGRPFVPAVSVTSGDVSVHASTAPIKQSSSGPDAAQPKESVQSSLSASMDAEDEAAALVPIDDLGTLPEAARALLDVFMHLASDRAFSMDACTLELGQRILARVPDPDLGDLVGLLAPSVKSLQYDGDDPSLLAGFGGEAVTVVTHAGLTSPLRCKLWGELAELSFRARQLGRGRFVVSLADGDYTWPGGLFDLRTRQLDNVEALCAYGNAVLGRLRDLDAEIAGGFQELAGTTLLAKTERDPDDRQVDQEVAGQVNEEQAEQHDEYVPDPVTEARWTVMRRFFGVFSFAMQRCSEKQARAIYCGEHVDGQLLGRLWNSARMSGSGMVVVCIDPNAGEFSIDGKLTGWKGQASVLSLEGVYHMIRGDQSEYRLDGFNAFLSWRKFFLDFNADLFIRDAAADIWLGTADKLFFLGAHCEYASNVLQWDYFEEFVKPELLTSFDEFKATVLET
jgi:hypothetical protein